MAEQVWMNGAIIDRESASVSIDDASWLFGAGLFETMRAINGTIFRYQQHVQRLCRSAPAILGPIHAGQLPALEQIERLLHVNQLSDARVRMTVTASNVRLHDQVEEQRLNVVVTCEARIGYPAEYYDQGVGVVISPYRQHSTDPLCGHKTTSYLPRLLALRHAQQMQQVEAIWFTERNHLAEGSISNIFIVKDNRLATPPLDTPILPGIARHAVLEIASEKSISCEETTLTINDLLDADEVFLTNSMMQVLPVVRIEKKAIGGETPGPMTIEIRQHFMTLVAKETTR